MVLVWTCLSTTSPGAVIGDPLITTFDGQRYTHIKQGTFSLWHFSGVETDFHSEEIAGTKKLPVDWQVYAHSDLSMRSEPFMKDCSPS